MSDNLLAPDGVNKTAPEETGEAITVKSEIGTTPEPDSVPEAAEAPVDDMKPRLERLGGEPAPDITPEEFARLQQAGQIHIDPRGRVRSTRGAEADAGVSLRKRRAWYSR